MSSTASPSPTSSTDASASTTTSPNSSNSNSSPPIFVGFIGVGVLALCLLTLCLWRRLVGRNHPFVTSAHGPNARRTQNDHGPANGRPEMFDAWIGERASDSLKWGESMPVSVTILADTEPNPTPDVVRKRRAGKRRSDSAREKEREKRDQASAGGGPGLQVAVLVAMPSPLHAQSHDGVGHGVLGSSLRDELAIGLIETPWIKEDRRSLKRSAS